MPYKRIVTDQPPTEDMMNAWDHQGWSDIQVIGPVVGRKEDEEHERVVFVVYMYRTVVEASRVPTRALS